MEEAGDLSEDKVDVEEEEEDMVDVEAVTHFFARITPPVAHDHGLPIIGDSILCWQV